MIIKILLVYFLIVISALNGMDSPIELDDELMQDIFDILDQNQAIQPNQSQQLNELGSKCINKTKFISVTFDENKKRGRAQLNQSQQADELCICEDYRNAMHINFCKICKKEMTGSLVRHMRIHTNERPYACSACPERFNQLDNAKRHMSKHASLDIPLYVNKLMDTRIVKSFPVKLVEFKCIECNKIFYNKYEYNRHLRTKPHLISTSD